MNQFPETAPYPELRIHRAALAHNLSVLRRLAPRSRVLLPVKANAYGCGMETLFPFFREAEVDMLGVANCNEAVQLRRLGWKKPVLNLGGFFAQNLGAIVAHEITPSITDLWQVAALDAAAAGRTIEVHLKLDLGMGRIGIRPEDFPELLRLLAEAKALRVAGIFTHFPHAGPAAREKTLAQNESFQQHVTAILSALRLERGSVILHAANSYSAAFFPETHHDMIRPGILFYGYYQSEPDRVEFNPRFSFKPSLELVVTPISRRILRRGDTVSYSGLYTVTDEREQIAVLPLGYADGIPRALSNQVSFGRYPLRGRVTMDQIMLGNYDGVSLVRLLGEGVTSLEQWGELSLSFSYEIMSHLGNRLNRVLV